MGDELQLGFGGECRAADPGVCAFCPLLSPAPTAWPTACLPARALLSHLVVQVYWGTENVPLLPNKVPGNQTTYTFNGNYNSPYLHRAVLSGLPTDTTIYYKVGGSSSGYSGVMNFTSHPGYALDASGSRFFALSGDLGQTSNSADTLAHMAAAPLSKFTAFLFPGDLSYADSNETRWDTFAQLISPYAQSLPTMPLAGNHEYEYLSGGGQTFVAFETRYVQHLPQVYPGTPQASNELYYSFKVAGMHVINLCTYIDFTEGSAQVRQGREGARGGRGDGEGRRWAAPVTAPPLVCSPHPRLLPPPAPPPPLQYTWLEAELASVDRSLTPWLIVQFHAPWYNSNTAHQ